MAVDIWITLTTGIRSHGTGRHTYTRDGTAYIHTGRDGTSRTHRAERILSSPSSRYLSGGGVSAGGTARDITGRHGTSPSSMYLSGAGGTYGNIWITLTTGIRSHTAWSGTPVVIGDRCEGWLMSIATGPRESRPYRFRRSRRTTFPISDVANCVSDVLTQVPRLTMYNLRHQ